MEVKILATIEVQGCGTVRIVHDCEQAAPEDQRDMFGIPPAASLSPLEREVIIENLAEWVADRFEIECKAALARARKAGAS